MRYAEYKGELVEADKGLSGVNCRCCGSEVIAKTGKIYVHHWAHKSKSNCNYKPMTQWHVDWQNNFKKEFREVITYDDSGEKHIADIMNNDEIVIEFQHSNISWEEVESRERQYEKLIWVLDGSKYFKYDNLEDVSTIFQPLYFSRIYFDADFLISIKKGDTSWHKERNGVQNTYKIITALGGIDKVIWRQKRGYMENVRIDPEYFSLFNLDKYLHVGSNELSRKLNKFKDSLFFIDFGGKFLYQKIHYKYFTYSTSHKDGETAFIVSKYGSLFNKVSKFDFIKKYNR